MKAIAAKAGRIIVTEVEEPELPAGHVRIKTSYSAMSPGTEMGMARVSGDEPVGLGYTAAGIIEKVGQSVSGFEPGQRVACYGAPFVRHAEFLSVPANLVAAVPDHVPLEEAAFAGLGAIGIHALRVADLRFGESAVVVGLGILGNLIAQIASAAALPTAALDLNPGRTELLRGLGLPHVFSAQEELEAAIPRITGGIGADSVLLCASGKGEKLINDAMKWVRDKGKVVIVGDLSMEFSRAAMFAKEVQVLISRAGGPGRYDAQYERENKDYPIGFVRWTEGRNTREYIRLLAENRIQVGPLITGIYPVDRAEEAYEQHKAAPAGSVGTLFKY